MLCTKRYFQWLGLVQLLWVANMANGQNTRLKDRNNIGWYNFFGTFATGKKTSIHAEYQWRRNDLLTDWQQSLLRVGLNYQVSPKLQLRLGYGWIETFPYGRYPINALGRDFTEHRLFQVATLSDKLGRAELQHRFMLEQRWLGRYSNPSLAKEDEYVFVNRMRYLYRMQFPLRGTTIADRTPYLALFNEIFIGFGKNVNENVFDQNRTALLLGYRFNGRLRLEAGYLNQTLQLGREVDGRNVFQYNNGVLVNLIINASWMRKPSQ